MFPIKDHNPTFRPAVVVPVIIAINVVMFLFVQPTLRGLQMDPLEREVTETAFFACRASIPYEVTHGELVLDAARRGEVSSQQSLLVAAAQDGFEGTRADGFTDPCRNKNVWLAIITSMFLHGGLLHIGGNMLFLWVFGNNIEDRLGRGKFLAFYLLAGIIATYAQAAINPGSTVPLIGASGAVAGVLGAYLLLYPRARVTTLVIFFFITAIELPAVIVLGLWFVLQVFQGVGSVAGDVGGVAYFAHIGGFLAGMAMLAVLRPRPQPPRGVYYTT